MERVIVIGGGPGAQTLLKTLGGFPLDLGVVLSMIDSGGSTGKLRKDLNILPTGDARKCLAALAKDDDGLLEQFLNYRFAENSSLTGHTAGNLMLAALKDIVGSEAAAIVALGKITQCRGRIYPSTTDNVHLAAEYFDGEKIVGEAEIVKNKEADKRIKKVWLEPSAKAYDEAVEAIVNSDLIVLGPSNLHRSIAPALLVEGILEAIKMSGALVAYVVNLSGIPGQTYNYSASQHVKELENYLGDVPLGVIVVNSALPPKEALDWYQKSNKTYVENDLGRMVGKVKVVRAPFGKAVKCDTSGDITFRHDPEQLSYELLRLAKRL